MHSKIIIVKPDFLFFPVVRTWVSLSSWNNNFLFFLWYSFELKLARLYNTGPLWRHSTETSRMKWCELREYKCNEYVTIAVNRNLSNYKIAWKKGFWGPNGTVLLGRPVGASRWGIPLGPETSATAVPQSCMNIVIIINQVPPRSRIPVWILF